MKLYSEYQKNRIDYHQNTTKNTVHRSSLIAPRFKNTYTNISFLNHFRAMFLGALPSISARRVTSPLSN